MRVLNLQDSKDDDAKVISSGIRPSKSLSTRQYDLETPVTNTWAEEEEAADGDDDADWGTRW